MLLEQQQRHLPNCVPKAFAVALHKSLQARYGLKLQVNQLETLLERVSKEVTGNWEDANGIVITEMLKKWHDEPDAARRVDVLAEFEHCTYSYLFNIGWEEVSDPAMVRKLVENERFGFEVVVITNQCFDDGRQHALVAKCMGHNGDTLQCSDTQSTRAWDLSFLGCQCFAVWAELPKADKFVNGRKKQEIENVCFQRTFRNDMKAYLESGPQDWLWRKLAMFDWLYLGEGEDDWEQEDDRNRRVEDFDRRRIAPVGVECLKQLFVEFLRKWADIDSAFSKLHASYEHLTRQQRDWISLPDFVECCREQGLCMDCQRIVKTHDGREAVDLDGAIRAAEFQEEHEVVAILSTPHGQNVPFLGNKLLAPVSAWAGTAIFPENINFPEYLEPERVVEAYKLALRPGVQPVEPGSPVRSSVLCTYTCDVCDRSIDGSHFRSAMYSRIDVCESCRSDSKLSQLLYLKRTKIMLSGTLMS